MFVLARARTSSLFTKDQNHTKFNLLFCSHCSRAQFTFRSQCTCVCVCAAIVVCTDAIVSYLIRSYFESQSIFAAEHLNLNHRRLQNCQLQRFDRASRMQPRPIDVNVLTVQRRSSDALHRIQRPRNNEIVMAVCALDVLLPVMALCAVHATHRRKQMAST